MQIKAKLKNYFSSINTIVRATLGVLVVLILFANYFFDEPITLLQRLELIAYDTRLRATMPNKPDPRIVIIDIDEKSLAAEGRWPWGRDKMALLIRQLFDAYKIKVIGFDVFFTEADTSSGLKNLEQLSQTAFKSSAEFQSRLAELKPSLDYDQQMATEMKKHSVVLSFAGNSNREELSQLKLGEIPTPDFSITTFGNKKVLASEMSGYSGNVKVLQDAASATGHVLPRIEFDGVIRSIPILVRYDQGYYEAMSVAVYRAFLDNEPIAIHLRDDEGDGYTRIKDITIKNAVIPVDEATAALIPFRGPTPMFRYISATDVMRGKLTPGELEGKMGIVGTSAQGLLDIRSTSVGEIYPGVEVHANMLSGYLDNNLKQKPPYEDAIKKLIILLIGLPLALALVRLSPLASTIAVVLIALVMAGLNFYFWQVGYALPIAVPLFMVGALYLVNMAYGFFIESRSKKQIAGMFGTYIPKELVDEMSKNPDAYNMQPETRDMTVLFSDVRNFTSISEGLTAAELTAMMNNYLTAMTATIQDQRGTIDKYIGDAIMAFWGAPLRDEKHAEHALLSALEMQKRLKEIAPDYIKRGWPALEIGVGLNNGPMNIGDMGSNFRRAYTVMGDAVNLAARLEGLTKEYGVGILVSENIVKTVDIAIYRELDRVRVKGKLEPISIYEPVGLKGQVIDQTIDSMDRFHRVLENYRKQQWDEAERLLTGLREADPTRKVYQVYLDRVALLRAKPPGANWDGVFTFTTK